MTTYRELHGKAVKTVTTNPSDDAAEGQIWFNSTDNTFKSIVSLEATSSASPLSTARAMCAGGGIQTASWLCGGSTGAPTVGTTHTENYNGTGWSVSGNLSNARAHFGATGVQTAGLAVAGGPPFSPSPGGAQNNVEEYDGEAWTGGGAIPTNVWSNGCFGIQTAAVSVGSEPNTTNYVFEYDGSSWTTGGTMNSIRSYVGTAGTLTAGIIFGGVNPMTKSETYDGTSFTAVPDVNTGSYSMFSGGTQTAAIKAGGLRTGGAGVVDVIEKYDGSTWSTSPATLATARAYSKGQSLNSPSNTAALFAGGTTNPSGPASQAVSSTEEFNISANVITAAAFSSGGSLNTARYDIVGTGLQTAAVAAGGYSSSREQGTENYDGTSWTTSSNKPTAVFAGAMAGTQTASFYASGNSSPGGGRTASTEHYDGSNWTSGGNVNTARQQIGAQNGGTLTAGIIFAGNGGTTATEHYDGTSWTTQPATVNDGRWNAVGTGDQTAAVMAGADNPATSNVEEYNGTAWSEVNNLPEIRYSGATIGTAQTDYIIASGQGPGGLLTNSVRYDGTNWSTGPSNSTARTLLGGSSQQPTSAGVIYGGYTPGGNKSDTEEWNGETTAINVKTLTQS